MAKKQKITLSPNKSEVSYVNQEGQVTTKVVNNGVKTPLVNPKQEVIVEHKGKAKAIGFKKSKCAGNCKGNPKSSHISVIPSTTCNFSTEICDECYTVISANPI